MKLKDVEISRLMPDILKDDATAKAINEVIEPEIKKVCAELKRLPVYSNLESLTEAELDAIASEIDIPWYNKEYSKDKKINIIKTSHRMMSKLGTPSIFSEVIDMIFDGCVLEEAGIDYEGDPHYFRAKVNSGENLTGDNFKRFMHVLKRLKRASSWLDNVGAYYGSESYYYLQAVQRTITITNTPVDMNGH